MWAGPLLVLGKKKRNKEGKWAGLKMAWGENEKKKKRRGKRDGKEEEKEGKKKGEKEC